jgi:adenylate cyclase
MLAPLVRLSYRLSLVVAIPLLVLVTGGLIAWSSLTTARDSTESLADALFGEVAHETSDRAAGHVRAVVPVLAFLGATLGNDPDALERNVLATRLYDALTVLPDATRVSFSGEDGSMLSLHREGGATTARILADVGTPDAEGGISIDEVDVEGGVLGGLIRTETAPDPRAGAPHVAAVDAGRRVWLPVHVLPESDELGVTCAMPIVDRDGRRLGVLALDIGLHALSRYVSALDLSARSRVILFSEDGTMLSRPVGDVSAAAAASPTEPMRVADVDDAVLRAFAANMEGHPHGDVDDEHEDEDGSGIHHFHFELEREEWLGSVLEFEVDEGVSWRVGVMAPTGDFLGFVDESIRRAAVIAALALAAAIAFALLLAGRVSRPLIDVVSQMRQIGRFELDAPPPRASVFSEIAEMQVAMQGMKGSLRSFASFVPRDVVRALISSGEDAQLGGSIREVTVFFSDVAGFTSMSEKVSPTELVDMLSGYLEAMTEVITAHGGTVDKFIGDGIMAFWGAPAEQADHAARACEAALACQQRLEELRQDDRHVWLRTAVTRIGVATGQALVGNVGTSTRMNYTAMGDVVNLAARLEAQNKSYDTQILVSESAYSAAKSRVLARAVDVVAVKGKNTGVRVYELLAPTAKATAGDHALAALADQALAAYLGRDFSGAIAVLDQILSAHPSDGAAAALRARAAEFALSPPPPDWSGVHVSETK